MKKIFTLIAAAAMTANTMAQDVEIVKVDDMVDYINEQLAAEPTFLPVSETMFVIYPDAAVYPYGTTAADVTYDASKAKGFASVKLEKSTANTEFVGLSTPHPVGYWLGGSEWTNDAYKMENQDFWDMTIADGFPYACRQFVRPKSGNPSLEAHFFWTKSEDGYSDVRYNDADAEVLYTLGCGKLPQKGCYYTIKTKTAGTVEFITIYAKPYNNSIVVLNTATMQEYTKDQITLNGMYSYRNKSVAPKVYPLTGELKIDQEYVEANYTDVTALGNYGKAEFMGVVKFEVEANTEYMIFSPTVQLGFYGYAFTPGGTTGIQNATAESTQAVRKSIVDGKVIIVKDGKNYTVAGQLVK